MSARHVVVLKPTSEPDEIGYTVNVPSLPGCITEGNTVEDALENAREAIALYIEALRSTGETLPNGDEIVTSVEVAASSPEKPPSS